METTLQPKLFSDAGVDDTDSKPDELSNGWYETKKYGPVFANHGKTWAVEIVGDRMINVVVAISKDDVIGPSAIEKMKAIVRRNSKKRLWRPGS